MLSFWNGTAVPKIRARSTLRLQPSGTQNLSRAHFILGVEFSTLSGCDFRPSTAAQVRKQMECLIEAVNAPPPSGETAELKRSPSNSTVVVANGVLSIPPQIYREYAAECRALARTATNESQRGLYLKMANTW